MQNTILVPRRNTNLLAIFGICGADRNKSDPRRGGKLRGAETPDSRLNEGDMKANWSLALCSKTDKNVNQSNRQKGL